MEESSTTGTAQSCTVVGRDARRTMDRVACSTDSTTKRVSRNPVSRAVSDLPVSTENTMPPIRADAIDTRPLIAEGAGADLGDGVLCSTTEPVDRKR